MNRLAMVGGLCLAIAGCSPADTYGPEQREKVTVSKLIYVPAGHGSDIPIGYGGSKGGGVTVTPVNIYIPERYGIVFQCRHRSFAIDGAKYKALWGSLHEGQEVTIRYRLIYKWKDKRATANGIDFLGVGDYE